MLPAGLGAGSVDPDTALEANAGVHDWLEPLPDALTPESAVTARHSVRLAVATALQELPARQRAVLILRDVVQFSAAEVAELLETTPAAVNSALQRARAHLAELAATEDSVDEPDDAERRELLDRYCAAFENADVAALTALLRAEVKLEMPPVPVWFTGRDAVMAFLVKRAFTKAGDIVMVPTGANGQPAVAEYRRGGDHVLRAHSIHVLTTGAGGIAGITVFLDPALFTVFGMPSTR
ncbi:ECF RNA polymerase sigma factor SigG [Mycobacterium talmoniae]|uniref:ECF RNA polymerase sigma factor SigG n=1 Tax=Mycobacterium talmoniae TaxID=1858794 RepID=A0A2S8BBN2_9MYCO|nr:ECF RNA polymerase sigma factor SigG [Mycobacterium talmoniae]